jgi:hypothetical protein
MALSKDQTIFTKMGTNYDDFRQGAPIQKAKKYYQGIINKNRERLWWLDEQKEEVVRPILRNFSSLDSHEKNGFRVELMVLFPEIFGDSQRKFEQPSLYLLTRHNIVCKSFRDIFTAGGQVTVNVNDKKIWAPRIVGKCLEVADKIREFLSGVDEDLLKECWNLSEDYVFTDVLSKWKSLVKKHRGPMNGVSFADIFDTGRLP